ncbi:uncharacterized protein LOC131059749 isoform X1 [Cryptomeria japonica]|uniref:uncharacterized protein LOC131059749 isoform X1 n=1 Tax=Cryptomeria japonica TaxID=3369 RepID=UPI0027DA71E0|nr:uncharacterized protein LOC131059749 isoform X1 [Cryptomeria japonica]XP_057848770.2 uncharacterized protein LOC131059749 isoform X1 [Cryptomeria japonica]
MDQFSQVHDATATAISFGLESYTGMSHVAKISPLQRPLSRTPNRKKNAPDDALEEEMHEGTSMPISSMMTPPRTTRESSEPSILYLTDLVGLLLVKGFKRDHHLKNDFQQKKPQHEASTEPRGTSKRLDFDDPPQLYVFL